MEHLSRAHDAINEPEATNETLAQENNSNNAQKHGKIQKFNKSKSVHFAMRITVGRTFLRNWPIFRGTLIRSCFRRLFRCLFP